MVAQLTVYFTYIIEQLGYWGAGFLMALESMIAPVPSELVMPFVGFLAAEDKFSIPTAILVTSLGSLIGSQKQAPRPLELKIWQNMAWEDHFVIYVKAESVTSRFLTTKKDVIWGVHPFRGLRQKKNLDDLIPSILEPEDLKPNHTWARLIQKI